MNYWERWIGDWKRKTAHLSAEDKGIYGELLDHEYATERALPKDWDALERISGARKPSECAAVRRVIGAFYIATDQGFVNARAAQEIERRRTYVDAQRERGALGLAARQAKAHKGNGAKPPAPAVELPEWLDAKTFSDWMAIRPSKARSPAAKLAAIAKLERFRAEGHDANALVLNSVANGWTGLFPPDHKRADVHSKNQASAEESIRRFKERNG